MLYVNPRAVRRLLSLSVIWVWGGIGSLAAERPNIVWISCEDISPHLGCYGDPHALTPNLDQLASEGVRFSHAYMTGKPTLRVGNLLSVLSQNLFFSRDLP